MKLPPGRLLLLGFIIGMIIPVPSFIIVPPGGDILPPGGDIAARRRYLRPADRSNDVLSGFILRYTQCITPPNSPHRIIIASEYKFAIV